MTTEHVYDAEPTLDSFGARLAIIRWSKGWNTKEAALACRIPEANWREWEAGRSPRRMVEIAQAISESTGYSDYWIMTGVSAPEPGPKRTNAATTRATRRTCVQAARPYQGLKLVA